MSNSSMDPFDEFEFKPLTDGLGFHKKAVNLKEDLRRSGVLDDELQTIPTSVPASMIEETPAQMGKKHTFEEVLSALEQAPLPRLNQELSFTETFARGPTQSPFPASEAYRTPNLPNAPTMAGGLKPAVAREGVGMCRGAADSPKRKVLQAASLSLPSAFLDFVIVLALSIVFLVALLTITKVDLNMVLKNLNQDLMTQVSLGLMFVAIMQMYVVISRSFFGRTLGEWTFDMQIGQDQEQKAEAYPLKIALRSLLTTFTGLIVLPLASLIVRRDLAGSISGARLYRQRL